ncbi:MAG: YggU family protein [Nitrospirota bacterium]|nr:YggU family protein [Nitrospirota bacterium]MDE3242131.1 YggU family protein [Nitrospirota bacterium]
MTPPYRQTREGSLLTLHVQPGAKKTEYMGLHGDALKVRVAAPPVEGAANEALCSWLAGLFKVPQKAITIQAGQTGRRKLVLLKGVALDSVQNVFTRGGDA